MSQTALFEGLFDDAAVFPPGNSPLADAIPAHAQHKLASYATTIGPFVLAAKDLDALADLTVGEPAGSLPLALTAPLDRLEAALSRADQIPAVRVVGLEISLPEGVDGAGLTAGLRDLSVPAIPIFVEVPRDERRASVIEALSDLGLSAKLRTGGIRAELYPDEQELAEAIVALNNAGVDFKATAGLHHALRNVDPETGFEQHGFLNLLLAAQAARTGASVDTVRQLLTEQNSGAIVDQVRALDAGVRESFRSFGTCSVREPIDELVDLGLMPAEYRLNGPR